MKGGDGADFPGAAISRFDGVAALGLGRQRHPDNNNASSAAAGRQLDPVMNRRIAAGDWELSPEPVPGLLQQVHHRAGLVILPWANFVILLRAP